MSKSERNRREYARIDARLRVRFRLVRGQDAEEMERELQEAPSVWAPAGETELLKLATSSGPAHEGLLAQAVLDIGRQVARLSHFVLAETGPAAVGELRQVSGSGGLMYTRAALINASRLDLRLDDDDPEAPPVRILAEILRDQQREEGLFALKFLVMHPTDRERLIRFIHSLQRRRLREASHRGHEVSG